MFSNASSYSKLT